LRRQGVNLRASKNGRASKSKRPQTTPGAGDERFQWLLKNAPDIIYRYRFAPIPGFEYISPAVTPITGYLPEDFYADPDLAFKLFYPDDPSIFDTLKQSPTLLQTRFTSRLIHKDGTIVWADHRVAPIYDSAGNFIAVEGIARDITERRQVEAQIEHNARQLSALGQIGQNIAASLDLKVVLKGVIEEMPSLLEADFVSVLLLENSDELVYAAASGAAWDNVIGQGMPAQAGIAGEALRTGQSVRVDDADEDARAYQDLTQNFDYHPRSILAVPLKLGSAIIGVMEAVHTKPNAFSASDLLRLEAAASWAAIAIGNARLFEAERQRVDEQAALLDISQMSLSSFALDKQVLKHIAQRTARACRAERCSLFILDDEQISLQPVMSQFADGHADPRLWKIFKTLLTERVDLVPAFQEAVRNCRPVIFGGDRTEHLLGSEWQLTFGIQQGLVAPLISQAQVIGLLVLDYPATHRFTVSQIDLALTVGAQLAIVFTNARLYTELERALQQEKAIRIQLVQSEKLAAMGRLAASVAHELNNPLQAIQNALYLVKQENALSEQAQADLSLVLGEARRMADLIERMRETYRPTIAEEFRPESLNRLIEEVQKLIDVHLRRNNVTLEFDPDPDLPNVPGIRDQLKQVILNLCLNAVEAMPKGGWLTILTRRPPIGGGAWLMIADTGIGIDAGDLPNIFDPFFTSKAGGTGLGLAITYDIIQRHKGRIEAESKSGRGTTFKIWLPDEN